VSADPDLLVRVRETIARHALLADAAPVLVAVSGGVDSMVLLHALIALRYRVKVAHFDHETRAGESNADAAFVRAHCAEIDVPCTVGHWRDWPVALPGAPSFEMEARARRYAFLLNTARALGCSAIATGHHADDQAETVLMRTLRGTGPGGIAGIPPIRIDGDMLIVRPLLGCSRAKIVTWARTHAIAWHEDRSNHEDAAQRNRVRNHLLPQLAAEYNPNVRDALARLAESARIEDDLLAGLAAELFTAANQGDRLARAPLRAAHEALQRRALLAWLKAHDIHPDHDALVEILLFFLRAETGQRLSLDADHLLHAADDEILLVRETKPAPAPETLRIPGECLFLGHRFVAQLRDHPPTEPLSDWCLPTRQIFDADRLGDTLCLRTRRNGDAFTPLGLCGTRKLQDYFIDRHVPRPDRDRVPILESAGEIVWIVGHASAENAAISKETKRFLTVEVTPCD